MNPSHRSKPRLARLLWVASFCGILHAGETLRIRLDPATTHQTIDGFGASDAWRCQFVGKNWPLEKRERIADLLFSRETDSAGNPKGIGLSIWRFYISSGSTEQGRDSGIGNPWRRGECFQNADGSHDWSKQAGQQWFLRAARKRGVERFLAFPVAPPVHMSGNGKAYASKGNTSLNIQPGKIADYAAFLAEVLGHFKKEGLPFDYLSPFNEPQWDWEKGSQEGSPALNTELHTLVRELSKELEQRKLDTRMVIGEAGTIGHVAKKVNNDGRDDQARFFFDPASPGYVGNLPNVAPVISAHDYFTVWPLDTQVEYRREMHAGLRAANPDLGYWMSEYCILQKNDEIGKGGRRDLGMDTALYVARIIHNSLTITHARSWQWWTALSQADYKDGLIYLDDGSDGASGRMGHRVRSLINDGEVRESKLLWAFGNYSRFIRPGMVRIACSVEPAQSVEDGVLVSAYKGTGPGGMIVAVNLSQKQQICDLGLNRNVDVYLTSEHANLKKTRQKASSVAIPARSVATIRLR